MVDEVEHHVVGQRAVPRLGASLGVDRVLRGGELVQQVEGFHAGYQFALQEGLA